MRKKHKLAKRLLTGVLSLALVFSSTNMPGLGITANAAELEKTLICEQTEHTHGADCYPRGELICGQEETEGETAESESLKAFVISMTAFIDKAKEYGWSAELSDEEKQSWKAGIGELSEEQYEEFLLLSETAFASYDDLTDEDMELAEAEYAELVESFGTLMNAIAVQSAEDIMPIVEPAYELEKFYVYDGGKVQLQNDFKKNLNGKKSFENWSYGTPLPNPAPDGMYNGYNITSMSEMFRGMNLVTTLDLSNFDTTNVTDMSGMFWDCLNLEELDLSSFDIRNVTDMNYMFYSCANLATLDLSSFDTRNVTNMNYMFTSCKNLATLDLSSFDTRNVTNMNYIFAECYVLTTLDVGNFDTTNAKALGSTKSIFKYVGQRNDGKITKGIANTQEIADTLNKYQKQSDNKPSYLTFEVRPHIHTWSYNVDGNALTVYCTEESCDYYGKDHACTITLQVSGIENGGTLTPTIVGDEALKTALGITDTPTVTYQGKDDTSYDSSTTAPTEVGTYEASVTINEQTITTEFAITKKQQSSEITVSSPSVSYTYGNTVPTPNLTGELQGGVTPTYYYNTVNSAEGGEEWNTLTPEKLSPGIYYVYAKCEETTEYAEYVTKPIPFIVKEKPVSTIEDIPDQLWTGSAIEPEIVVKDGATVIPAVEYKVDYSNNVDEGTATVTVTDKEGGYYEVNGIKTFTIYKHTHEWGYTAEGATITATCSAKNCPAPEQTLTITAPANLLYTETAKEASLDKTSFADIASMPVIEYFKGATKLDSAPIEVGTYTAKITVDNATASVTFKVDYLDVDASEIITVTGTQDDNNEWYRDDVTIAVGDDYEISEDKNQWDSVIKKTDDGTYDVTYYLKDKATGGITVAKKVALKIDKTYPTGGITIGKNTFNQFLNTITFDHFFKETVTVNIEAIDALSGVAKVEYQKVSKAADYNGNGTWTAGKNFSVAPDEKFIVYVRITDNAGNITYLNSDGVVVYTDATPSADVTYTRTGEEDITTDIEIRNNEIVKISYVKDDNAEVSKAASSIAMTKEVDYTVVDGKIVLKANFLKNLFAGKYVLTVNYNAMGEAFIEGASTGVKPTDSTINLAVKKAEGEVSITNNLSKTYDGKAVVAPTFTQNSTGKATVEYKAKYDKDSAYKEKAPVEAGTYTVRVTVATDKNYTEASATKDFTIAKAGSSILAPSTTVTKTYGDADFTLDVSGVGGNRPTFTSSNEKIATVDKDGKVSIKGAGTVKITVEIPSSSNYAGTSKEITLNIAPKGMKDAIVTLGDPIQSNDTVQTQEVKSVVVDGKEITYTVTGNTVKEPGNYVMIIKGTGNYTGTIEVPFIVVQGIVHVESVKLNKTTLTLERVGDSENLKANIAPSNTTDKKVTWKSSNTKVAKVDANGKVTAVGAGTATITVTTADGAKKITCKVTVQGASSDLKVAKFGDLKVKASDEKKTSMRLSWASTPEADGYLIYGNLCDAKTQKYAYKLVKDVPAENTSVTRTGLTAGTYYKHYVVAYKNVGGKKKRIAVSVPIHATTAGGKYGVAQSVKVTKISKTTSTTKVTLAKGTSVQVSAIEVKGVKPISLHRGLCYESSNTKVVKVSATGKITAVAKGKAKIWVYAQNGVYKSIEVTVK